MKPALKRRDQEIEFKALRAGDVFTAAPDTKEEPFKKALFVKLSDKGPRKAQWVNNEAMTSGGFTISLKPSTLVWPVDVEWE